MSRIAFKTPELIDHWHQLHPTLLDVVRWMASEVWEPIIRQPYMTITSAIRDDGIHAWGRAVDVSLRDSRNNSLLPLARRTRAAALINGVWRYGKVNPTTGNEYEVCYHHKVGDSEWHYHIQVRDETGRRDGWR